jgi:hypothetical protein
MSDSLWEALWYTSDDETVVVNDETSALVPQTQEIQIRRHIAKLEAKFACIVVALKLENKIKLQQVIEDLKKTCRQCRRQN